MRSLILFAVACLALSAVEAEDKKCVICYLGSWAAYRQGAGKFEIENIDPTLCTHLIYGFVGLAGTDIKILDPWQDLSDNWGKNGFGRFNALREQNPNLKTMVAIGGWNEGSVKYSAMASNPATRRQFVNNAVAFLEKYNFDGLDIDWEYPAQRGGSASDVKNFAFLVKELRRAMKSKGFLLSAAVSAAESSASLSYDIAEISENLDFINLMTYDFHGSWEPYTGINAPLFPAANELSNNRQLNVDAAVNYWLGKGAAPEKLMVGIASYGRSFTLANPNAAKIGDPCRGTGAAGPYTNEAGMLGYNEICEFLKTPLWTLKFDEERRVPYAYNNNQWVGFDNIESVKEKAEYIQRKGLGGAMVWSLETDDFRGNCGEKYPLIKSLNEVLRNGSVVSQVPPLSPKPTKKPIQEPTVTYYPDNSGSSGKCTKTGDIADPTDCKKFIKCVDLGNGKFDEVPFYCGPNLCYKPEIGICDWI